MKALLNDQPRKASSGWPTPKLRANADSRRLTVGGGSTWRVASQLMTLFFPCPAQLGVEMRSKPPRLEPLDRKSVV